jgi:hypothetical protein
MEDSKKSIRSQMENTEPTSGTAEEVLSEQELHKIAGGVNQPPTTGEPGIKLNHNETMVCG